LHPGSAKKTKLIQKKENGKFQVLLLKGERFAIPPAAMKKGGKSINRKKKGKFVGKKLQPYRSDKRGSAQLIGLLARQKLAQRWGAGKKGPKKGWKKNHCGRPRDVSAANEVKRGSAGSARKPTN